MIKTATTAPLSFKPKPRRSSQSPSPSRSSGPIPAPAPSPPSLTHPQLPDTQPLSNPSKVNELVSDDTPIHAKLYRQPSHASISAGSSRSSVYSLQTLPNPHGTCEDEGNNSRNEVDQDVKGDAFVEDVRNSGRGAERLVSVKSIKRRGSNGSEHTIMTNPWSHAHGDADYDDNDTNTDLPASIRMSLELERELRSGSSPRSRPTTAPSSTSVSRSDTLVTSSSANTRYSSFSAMTTISGLMSASGSNSESASTSTSPDLKPTVLPTPLGTNVNTGTTASVDQGTKPAAPSHPNEIKPSPRPTLPRGNTDPEASSELVPPKPIPRLRESTSVSAALNAAYRASSYEIGSVVVGGDYRSNGPSKGEAATWEKLGKFEHPSLASTFRERERRSSFFGPGHERTTSAITLGPGTSVDPPFRREARQSFTSIPPGLHPSLAPGVRRDYVNNDASAKRASAFEFGVLSDLRTQGRSREVAHPNDQERYKEEKREKDKEQNRKTIAGQYSPPQIFLSAPTPAPGQMPSSAAAAQVIKPRPVPVHIDSIPINSQSVGAAARPRSDNRVRPSRSNDTAGVTPSADRKETTAVESGNESDATTMHAKNRRESVFNFGEMGVPLGKPKSKRKGIFSRLFR